MSLGQKLLTVKVSFVEEEVRWASQKNMYNGVGELRRRRMEASKFPSWSRWASQKKSFGELRRRRWIMDRWASQKKNGGQQIRAKKYYHIAINENCFAIVLRVFSKIKEQKQQNSRKLFPIFYFLKALFSELFFKNIVWEHSLQTASFVLKKQ